MKVTCQSCQAKYSIADEKVRGKIAKIRCKKCGTTIMVDGTAANGDSPSTGSTAVDAQTAGAGDPTGMDDVWTVLVADDDQRTVSPAQIAEMYASGVVTLETHVWKDGMPDWLPIEQVDTLRAMLQGGQAEAAPAAVVHVPAESPAQTASAHSSSSPAASREPAAAFAPNKPTATSSAPKAAAQPAARTEPRKPGRGGSADLFGASGGDDVLTSAPPQGTANAADKPTGARNENSVLFSLSALTGSKPAPSRDEPSGTADLRSLAGASGNGASGKSKFDEIMNLGAGGIYAGSLASPALAPPPVDEPVSLPDTSTPAPAQQKSKTVWIAVAGALIGVAGIAVALASQVSGSDGKSGAVAGGASVAASTTNPTTNTAPSETAAPIAQEPPAPTAIVPGAVPTKAEPESKETKPAAPAKPQPGGGAAAKEEPKKPTNNLQAIGQAIANEKPAPAAPTAAPAAPTGASFDRAAAISALSAIASAVQACKRPDGPTGTGRVSITFAPSGNATTANVEGPPFAGTPVGGCIAARFRTARVPPFAGDTVTVHKTFSIN